MPSIPELLRKARRASDTAASPESRDRGQGARPVRATIGFVAALLWVGVATPAGATVVLPVEFSEMVGESQVIVHGRVAEVQSQMRGDRRTIESLVTVTVTQALKGEPGATVVFRVPNGQVGQYRRVTVGAPEFTQGDEVVLFLRGRSPGVPMPFGLHQGVYRVERPTGGGTRVSPAAVLHRTPGSARVVRGDPARRPVSIEAFVHQVRVVVAGGQPGVRSARPRGGAGTDVTGADALEGADTNGRRRMPEPRP